MSIDAIKGIKAYSQAIRDVQNIIPSTTPGDGVAAPQKGVKFGEMFSNALKEVDALQKGADDQIEGMTLNKQGYTSHGAMIALEKADVAFQLMSSVRSKIIRAYEEVIRTQV